VRVLVVGAGGVGGAVAPIAARRDCFERILFSDLDLGRAEAAAARDERFGAARLDASDPAAIVELARAERVDAILNAADPRFNPPIFGAAFEAGCTYLDMAMTLSKPGCTYVAGTGKDGSPRATYLYHLVDNEESMRRDGAQGGRLSDRPQTR
jgi:saccharopine dehydrogenase-like NADP-dependent oxidoreductase